MYVPVYVIDVTQVWHDSQKSSSTAQKKLHTVCVFLCVFGDMFRVDS